MKPSLDIPTDLVNVWPPITAIRASPYVKNCLKKRVGLAPSRAIDDSGQGSPGTLQADRC